MLRTATKEDIPAIVEMGRKMIADGSYSVFAYSPDRVAAFLDPIISHGFAVVVERDGRLIGGMLGDVVTPWFSEERMGVEHVLYLEPEHRSGLMAARLIGRWVKWCTEQGAVQFRPGISTGDEAGTRLYSRLGFERVGATFCMNAR